VSIEHPLLRDAGVRHGFGLRDEAPPPDVLRPKQVHGARVVEAPDGAGREADVIVARAPFAGRVGVVTADCVPVLLAGAGADALAGAGADAVAAIHAGWRGLAAGVLEAGVEALRCAAGDAPLVAVAGPHIGPCCYEVDAPVTEPLRERFGPALDAALRASRPGHWRLDLGRLARQALHRAGLEPAGIGFLAGACTACDPRRFHSHRRDGPRAGRLLHWIGPGALGRSS